MSIDADGERLSVSNEGDKPRLFAANPLVNADDYLPALWIPVARLAAVQRRIQTLAAKLPESAWQADSALAGWNRKDVLAHITSHSAQHQRPVRAALDGEPLRELIPDPERPAMKMAEWNEEQVTARRAWSIERLIEEFDATLAELLGLWSRVTDEQLLLPYGLAPNLLAGIDRHGAHLNGHADDIVNGPQMMR